MIRAAQLEVYDVCLITRAPLFIGCGRSYGKKEYVFLPPESPRMLSPKVMLLDEKKLFPLLVERNLIDKYETFMLGGETNLYRFLTAECRLSMGEIQSFTRCVVDAADALDPEHTLKEIFAFVRDGNGRVYVPGSSLKGALRTAILTDMVMREKAEIHSPDELWDKGFEGKYLNSLSLKKNKNGVVQNDAVNSILQGLRISDSEPVPDNAMILAGKIDGDIRGETHRINLCRECIRPGTEIHFKLTLDQSVVGDKITIDTVRDAICQFDRFYEYIWVQSFRPPGQQAAVSYENALVLGGGAGYVSKTVTYPYLEDDVALQEVIRILNKAFPKHRHPEDAELNISPRVAKYALYRGKLYPYGLCEVNIT